MFDEVEKKSSLGFRPGLFMVLVAVALSSIASAQPIGPSPYWKNQIAFPDDPFRANGAVYSEPGWVKFTILLSDRDTVYFQDSRKYQFHYNFATDLLDPFIGMNTAEFDRFTLYAEGQQAILGGGERVLLGRMGAGRVEVLSRRSD